jgi:AraC-like DNA-binding protein
VIEMLSNVATFALFVAALHAAWRGLADDLDPLRRSRRLQLLGIGLIVGLAIAASALANPVGGDRTWVATLFAGAILFVAAAYAVNSFVLEADATTAAAPTKPRRTVGPDDTDLIARIRRAFAEDKLHRRDGLTVAGLAHHLDTPEYQIRRTINRGLGFKNFSTFVNEHRIGEVKQALGDPAQGEVPISTIALDAGYGSLATFNRTFKEATGLSPTEFRRRAQAL